MTTKSDPLDHPLPGANLAAGQTAARHAADGRHARRPGWALAMALLLLAGGLAALWASGWTALPAGRDHSDAAHPGAAQPGGPYVTMDELEARYGLRVTLIGVTAAGGMVDFRFRVTDAAKTAALFASHQGMPSLRVLDRDVTVSAPDGSPHMLTFEDGKVYYFLFGNPSGAVQPGSLVSVSIGDLQLEPQAAQ
ncbi:MAG: hypothetical protein ACKOC5_00650 [Chloroflexota bacterium]